MFSHFFLIAKNTIIQKLPIKKIGAISVFSNQTSNPAPTDPASLMTPLGETNIPDPIIVPTIKLIPAIKLTSLLSSTF